ncbi:MAG: amidohydrolase, partial [Desulfovibrio sp.]|nr:amidohydrolase [Desulfovibrio sp.]
MKIFDFRLRPPYKHFNNLGIYANPVCNEASPQKWHGKPSQAAREKSLDLFWQEMDEAGISAGVIIGRQVPDDTASVPNDDIH